jgi:hypothetical protein
MHSMQGQKDIWTVLIHEAFAPELRVMQQAVRIEVLAMIDLLEMDGPGLARPYADTLSGSAYPNMKELRFDADGGVWRVAFAFDPVRRAILLVAGDKSGVSQKRFYKTLIAKADKRFGAHLAFLTKKEK